MSGVRVTNVKSAPTLTPIDQSPGKVMWLTEAVEWFEGPPPDLTVVPAHILKGLHRFDPDAYPLFCRRVFKTPEGKTVIRIHHAMAYQKRTPSTEKEPINVLRSTYPGPLRRFNGPLYEDRVLEWFPPAWTRRDRPGVFQPWDDIRLAEMKHQFWQLYGRHEGLRKTETFLQSLVPNKATLEERLAQDGMDRLNDAAGPFRDEFVGYSGKQLQAGSA